MFTWVSEDGRTRSGRGWHLQGQPEVELRVLASALPSYIKGQGRGTPDSIPSKLKLVSESEGVLSVQGPPLALAKGSTFISLS